MKRRRENRAEDQPMKTARQDSPGRGAPRSYAAMALDKIKAIVIVASASLALILVLAFYYISWQALSTRSHTFVIAWALIATTLIIVCAPLCLAIGAYFGLKQSDFVLSGIKLAVTQVIQAAEQVSEVRVMTLGKYSRMPERRGTQEWMVDNDIFGLHRPERPGLPGGEDIRTIDMPTDQNGKPGE